jgi:hypothetical protein
MVIILLNFGDYQKPTGGHQKIADLLAMPGIEDVTLDIPPLRDLIRAADLFSSGIEHKQ